MKIQALLITCAAVADCTVRSESSCAIVNVVGSDVHELVYRPNPV
jgi:hypothetical protein